MENKDTTIKQKTNPTYKKNINKQLNCVDYYENKVTKKENKKRVSIEKISGYFYY